MFKKILLVVAVLVMVTASQQLLAEENNKPHQKRKIKAKSPKNVKAKKHKKAVGSARADKLFDRLEKAYEQNDREKMGKIIKQIKQHRKQMKKHRKQTPKAAAHKKQFKAKKQQWNRQYPQYREYQQQDFRRSRGGYFDRPRRRCDSGGFGRGGYGQQRQGHRGRHFDWQRQGRRDFDRPRRGRGFNWPREGRRDFDRPRRGYREYRYWDRDDDYNPDPEDTDKFEW